LERFSLRLELARRSLWRRRAGSLEKRFFEN
jgi:hypothetical protein